MVATHYSKAIRTFRHFTRDIYDGFRLIFAGCDGPTAFRADYTLSLLADIAEDEWFRVPPGAKTHLAWQVGHLAMAEYGLCLFRVRGRKSEDLELMPSKFRKQYSRGSTPDANPATQSTPAELLATLAAIHTQSLTEMATYTSAQLDEPTDMPYAVYPTKLVCSSSARNTK